VRGANTDNCSFTQKLALTTHSALLSLPPSLQMGMVPGMGGGQPQVWQGKAAYKAELGALGTTEWSPAPLLAAEKELLEEAEALRAGRRKDE
jgi:hypothetical protein